MNKSKIYKLAILSLLYCISGGETFLFAADAASSAPVAASAGQNISTTADENPERAIAIAEEVARLQSDRIEKMPYLDRSFIRSRLNEEDVKARYDFLAMGQKDLKTIVGRASEVYTPALVAKERIALAKRRIITALRELFPQAEWKYERRDGTLSGDPYNAVNFNFTFRQPLFRGGILWHTLLQEKAGLEVARREYDVEISQLINDVSSAYFDYNRAMEVLADRQETLERVGRFVQISESKWKEELISEIEHLNSQSLASQMQYDYETEKQELELAKLEMEKFLNIGASENLVVRELYDVEKLLSKEKLPGEVPGLDQATMPGNDKTVGLQKGSNIPNLEVLVDLAYQNRPELQVESAKLSSARYEEKVKWGEVIPHADLVMEFGKLGEAFNVNSLNPLMKDEFRLLFEVNWNAAGNKVNYTFENDENAPSVSQFQAGTGSQTTRNTLTVGLLDGLETLADIKEAEVERLEQVVELENAEKEVIHDIKEAYYDYQRALIQVKSALKRVEYRKRLLGVSEHRLGSNEIQISEYLQAEIDLLRERKDLHTALSDYFRAKAALNHATGVKDFLLIEDTYGQ